MPSKGRHRVSIKIHDNAKTADSKQNLHRGPSFGGAMESMSVLGLNSPTGYSLRLEGIRRRAHEFNLGFGTYHRLRHPLYVGDGQIFEGDIHRIMDMLHAFLRQFRTSPQCLFMFARRYFSRRRLLQRALVQFIKRRRTLIEGMVESWQSQERVLRERAQARLNYVRSRQPHLVNAATSEYMWYFITIDEKRSAVKELFLQRRWAYRKKLHKWQHERDAAKAAIIRRRRIAHERALMSVNREVLETERIDVAKLVNDFMIIKREEPFFRFDSLTVKVEDLIKMAMMLRDAQDDDALLRWEGERAFAKSKYQQALMKPRSATSRKSTSANTHTRSALDDVGEMVEVDGVGSPRSEDAHDSPTTITTKSPYNVEETLATPLLPPGTRLRGMRHPTRRFTFTSQAPKAFRPGIFESRIRSSVSNTKPPKDKRRPVSPALNTDHMWDEQDFTDHARSHPCPRVHRAFYSSGSERERRLEERARMAGDQWALVVGPEDLQPASSEQCLTLDTTLTNVTSSNYNDALLLNMMDAPVLEAFQSKHTPGSRPADAPQDRSGGMKITAPRIADKHAVSALYMERVRKSPPRSKRVLLEPVQTPCPRTLHSVMRDEVDDVLSMYDAPSRHLLDQTLGERTGQKHGPDRTRATTSDLDEERRQLSAFGSFHSQAEVRASPTVGMSLYRSAQTKRSTPHTGKRVPTPLPECLRQATLQLEEQKRARSSLSDVPLKKSTLLRDDDGGVNVIQRARPSPERRRLELPTPSFLSEVVRKKIKSVIQAGQQ
eukprot:PhM_4_TR17036/c0_g1_i1/m.94645